MFTVLCIQVHGNPVVVTRKTNYYMQNDMANKPTFSQVVKKDKAFSKLPQIRKKCA